MFSLGKLFLQVQYHCNSQDKQNLDLLQKQMQERVTFLNEHNLDSYSDPHLLQNYELYSQIQQCLFQDHTGQYILIAGIVIGISLLVYVRLWMIKKYGSKNLNSKK